MSSAAENTAQAVQEQAQTTAKSTQAAAGSILDQAQHLAKDALSYGSGLLQGVQAKGVEVKEQVAGASVPGDTNKTFGELVTETKELAANALHKAHDYVQPKEGEAPNATNKARGLVATALDYVTPATQKVEQTIGSSPTPATATQEAVDAKIQESEKVAADLKAQAQTVGSDVGTKASQP